MIYKRVIFISYPVGKVGGHDEVVLYDEPRLLSVQDKPLDDLGGDKSLLRIQVRRRLV